MRTGSDLFDLIKSLSGSEKRHFRLYSAIQPGAANYKMLFDELERLPYYEETKLRSKLAHHPVSRHWAFNKQYLHGKILESLCLTRLRDDADSEVGNLLESYKVLKEKGLGSQANRFLRRAKKKARDNDLFTRLYSIITLEYFDTLYSSRKAADRNLERIISERQDVLDIIENYSFIADIYSKLRLTLLLGGGIKSAQEQKRLRAVVQPLLKLRQDELLSDTAIVLFNMALGEYHYYATGDSRKGLFFLRQNLTESSRTAKPDLVISEVSTFISMAIRSRDVDDLQPLLNQLYSFVDHPPAPYKHLVYERWFNFTLSALCIKGQFADAFHFFENELTRFHSREKATSKLGRISNYYAIAYACFGARELDTAVYWVSKILHSDETDLETYTVGKVLQLVLFFEKSNFDLIEYQHGSLRRHLKSKKRANLSKLGLAELFMKLCSNDPRRQMKALEEFSVDLRRFKDEPTLRNFEVHFDLSSWISCKLRKAPFSEMVRERYGR